MQETTFEQREALRESDRRSHVRASASQLSVFSAVFTYSLVIISYIVNDEINDL